MAYLPSVCVLKMKDEFSSESVDKAQSKADAQRDKLARLPLDDPTRSDEERILDLLIDNVQLAMTAHILLDEEPDAAPGH